MPKNRISSVLSNFIGDLRRQGKSAEEISEIIHLPISTIKYHVNLQRNLQPRNNRLPGRPHCTSSATDAAIVLTAKRRRRATNPELATDFQVSTRTVRRRLSSEGIRSCIAVEEHLKPTQKRNRVNWCRQNRETNFDFWLFSDESSFELTNLSIPRRSYVHRRATEKYAQCCMETGGLRTRQKLMVWGCIFSDGAACIEIIRGNIDAERYIDILRTHLIPFLDSLPLATLRRVSFQHDNAPPHRAMRTRRFLEEEGIAVPVWPPCSPDLNPIEEVWALVKREVRRSRPRTLQSLEEAIRDCWTRIVTPALCTRLYASMQNRIERVISHRGSR